MIRVWVCLQLARHCSASAARVNSGVRQHRKAMSKDIVLRTISRFILAGMVAIILAVLFLTLPPWYSHRVIKDNYPWDAFAFYLWPGIMMFQIKLTTLAGKALVLTSAISLNVAIYSLIGFVVGIARSKKRKAGFTG